MAKPLAFTIVQWLHPRSSHRVGSPSPADSGTSQVKARHYPHLARDLTKGAVDSIGADILDAPGSTETTPA